MIGLRTFGTMQIKCSSAQYLFSPMLMRKGRLLVRVFPISPGGAIFIRIIRRRVGDVVFIPSPENGENVCYSRFENVCYGSFENVCYSTCENVCYSRFENVCYRSFENVCYSTCENVRYDSFENVCYSNFENVCYSSLKTCVTAGVSIYLFLRLKGFGARCLLGFLLCFSMLSLNFLSKHRS